VQKIIRKRRFSPHMKTTVVVNDLQKHNVAALKTFHVFHVGCVVVGPSMNDNCQTRTTGRREECKVR
jgi:hypothetical protein